MTENGKIKILILAGGKGKRMQSDLPKCLSLVCNKPMIQYLVDSVAEITKEKPVAIVGHLAEFIKKGGSAARPHQAPSGAFLCI